MVSLQSSSQIHKSGNIGISSLTKAFMKMSPRMGSLGFQPDAFPTESTWYELVGDLNCLLFMHLLMFKTSDDVIRMSRYD